MVSQVVQPHKKTDEKFLIFWIDKYSRRISLQEEEAFSAIYYWM